MPRLLLVSYVFPPMAAGGAVRTGQLARFLPEHGWDVTVLTATCSETVAVDTPALESLPEQVKVERAWSPNQLAAVRGRSHARGGWRGTLRRTLVGLGQLASLPDRQVTWLPAAVRAGARIIRRERPDVVLTSYGPGTSALVGARLARRFDLPLVVDFRDLWSDLPVDVFASRWHRRYAARLERRCVRAAARITCVSERMARHLADAHGRDPADVVAVPNGFDPGWLDRLGVSSSVAAACDRLRIVFAGALHRFHDVDPFLRGLGRAVESGRVDRSRVEVEFVGNLDPAVPARLGLADVVKTRPFVPHSEVAGILAGADVLLLLEPSGYWGELSYSAKTFDYAVTGKPVLALVEPHANSARLLRDLGTGIIVPPADVDAIGEALGRLAARTLDSVPVDATSPPLARFDRRRLAGTMAQVLEAAARSHRHRSSR